MRCKTNVALHDDVVSKLEDRISRSTVQGMESWCLILGMYTMKETGAGLELEPCFVSHSSSTFFHFGTYFLNSNFTSRRKNEDADHRTDPMRRSLTTADGTEEEKLQWGE